MISQSALKEVADAGGFVVLPWHDQMYSDYDSQFAVMRPSWWDDEKTRLEVTGVNYTKDEEGYSKFLNDWDFDFERGKEYRVSVCEKQ